MSSTGMRPARHPTAPPWDLEGNALFDPYAARRDFPMLEPRVGAARLVYLDSAASTQKPRQVIDAVSRFYERAYANVHRGVYRLSDRATAAFEEVREKVRRFVNAEEAREIVFVRGTTEAINLVAQTFGRNRFGPGDEVLLTAMEHHSNIVPWQIVCEEKGAHLRVIPMNADGELVLEEAERLLTSRTKLLAVIHVSNALGTVNPLKPLIEMAHQHGVPVLVDGAQAVSHLEIDVRALGCDFYAFSAHKMYGPTGIGVLFGRAEILQSMPPYQGGGDMILTVDFEKSTYKDIPHRFEAGTPDIAGVIGLGAAIDYLQGIDRAALFAHEARLLVYATAALQELPGARVIGTARRKSGVLSFVVDGAHPHDIGTILDHEGIAVRAGHHCAQPTMDHFRVPATTRVSFGLYNTREDIDALANGMRRVVEVLGG